MHAQIYTIASCSIETIASMVQIHTASGLPAMAIVELPLPPKRIAVNPALADGLKTEHILIYPLPLA